MTLLGWAPDNLETPAFAELVAPLFEDAPRFIGRLAADRPHGTWDGLFAAAVRIALEMPPEEQIELIDAHPRIGAPPRSVSALSFVEQGYAQESDKAAAQAGESAKAGESATESAKAAETERAQVQTQLDRLNAMYEAKFGFRFVIFVAGRPRAHIVPIMETALEADEAAERERALLDVVAIARDRAISTGLTSGSAGGHDPRAGDASKEDER